MYLNLGKYQKLNKLGQLYGVASIAELSINQATSGI